MAFTRLATLILGLTCLLSACAGLGEQSTSNQPPTVSLTANPVSGPVPFTVTMNATARDPDGDTLTYLWDVAGQQGRDDSSFSYTFNEPGEYRIGVTVQDSEFMVSAVATVLAYDEGAPPTEPAPPSQPAPPTSPVAPLPPSGTIESVIVSDFDGFERDNIYQLANGQVWQQTEFYFWFYYAFRPPVTIYSSQGQTKMHVDGINHDVTVIQLQ